MAFINSFENEKFVSEHNVNIHESFQTEFSFSTILTNQQSIILDMQEKMEFIIPKMENEMIRFENQNKLLLEKSAAQDLEIRKLRQKIYQTQKYSEGSRNELLSKLAIVENEIQQLDSAYELLKMQFESNSKSFDLCKTVSYRSFSQRTRI
tara:strand:- start:1343 stop:1795 length:453 start_codon:yes stop_codon:yes gene_type:complete